MPVYSMTGYASVQHAGGLTVECRSVNGRFLDLTLKLPEDLRGFEPALRELTTTALRRGKVEMRLSLPDAQPSGLAVPAFSVLQQLLQAQGQIQAVLPTAAALSVSEVLALARSLNPTAREDSDVPAAAQACLKALQEARAREGARLVQILLDRVSLIEALAQRAAALVPGVVQRQQARFLERWNEALQGVGAAPAAASVSVSPQAAQERALAEAAAYAIRIDVAEELTRLQAHLQEIRRLLEAGGELGKRLDFLIQELHREANTLGSKSAALELTGISVDMKVAIEQMREQVQNIE